MESGWVFNICLRTRMKLIFVHFHIFLVMSWAHATFACIRHAVCIAIWKHFLVMPFPKSTLLHLGCTYSVHRVSQNFRILTVQAHEPWTAGLRRDSELAVLKTCSLWSAEAVATHPHSASGLWQQQCSLYKSQAGQAQAGNHLFLSFATLFTGKLVLSLCT